MRICRPRKPNKNSRTTDQSRHDCFTHRDKPVNLSYHTGSPLATAQGGKKMYANKVMTYDQWEHRFKKALKKTIRKKLASIMWGILTIALFMLPFWMVIDWLLRGY